MKEYYGLVPAHFSVNLDMTRAYLQQPNTPLNALLDLIARQYGAASEPLLHAWETTATAMEVFPWNASWGLRRIFESPNDRVFAEVPTASWMTLLWQANRCGFYMVTDMQGPRQHPWLKEDVAPTGLASGGIIQRSRPAAYLCRTTGGK